MQDIAPFLPHVNASLNSVATVLLILSFVAIKAGRESLHRNLMFAAISVSALFLTSYLTYHYFEGSKKFPAGDYPIAYAYIYWVMLASHILLAISVPFLSIWAMILGLQDKRKTHRSVVRWAFPIWLYVSITGVLVYFMLYWWFVPKVQQAVLIGAEAFLGPVL